MVQNGIDTSVQKQRYELFGANVIDIEAKSSLSLLVDEVRWMSRLKYRPTVQNFGL